MGPPSGFLNCAKPEAAGVFALDLGDLADDAGRAASREVLGPREGLAC